MGPLPDGFDQMSPAVAVGRMGFPRPLYFVLASLGRSVPGPYS